MRGKDKGFINKPNPLDVPRGTIGLEENRLIVLFHVEQSLLGSQKTTKGRKDLSIGLL
jgi:hypothetical protein